MPARKSNTSMVSTADEGSMPARDGMSVDDLSLPRTMIQRLAKGVLPANTQIQKDALQAMSKSATVFVNYLTSHANENAMSVNKKTIQPQDVLDAIRDLEFADFLPRLEAELQKYNAIQCDKRNTYRRKVREQQQAARAAAGEAGLNGMLAAEHPNASSSNGQTTRDVNGGSPPAAKKVRRSSVDGGEGEDTDMENGDGEEEQEQEHEDDEPEEEDEEGEGEGEGEGGAEDVLVEDPIEDREGEDVGDEALEGDESD